MGDFSNDELISKVQDKVCYSLIQKVPYFRAVQCVKFMLRASWGTAKAWPRLDNGNGSTEIMVVVKGYKD